MPGKRRIFWTREEKNTVLAAARNLREQQPRLTLKQVGLSAQATLPKQRRRPVNNKLTSWLSAGLKGGSRIAKVSSRAKAVKPAAAAAPRAKAAKGIPAAQPNMLQALIEQGAAILSGVLRHPSVQEAFERTLRRKPASRKR
jgi:hypothetical protein